MTGDDASLESCSCGPLQSVSSHDGPHSGSLRDAAATPMPCGCHATNSGGAQRCEACVVTRHVHSLGPASEASQRRLRSSVSRNGIQREPASVQSGGPPDTSISQTCAVWRRRLITSFPPCFRARCNCNLGKELSGRRCEREASLALAARASRRRRRSLGFGTARSTSARSLT